MKKNKLKLNSKYVILIIIFLCFVTLSAIYIIGKNNNINSEIDFENYAYAQELIQTNQADKAIGILKQLDEQYSDNIFIKRYLGLAYASSGDSRKGALYFQDCLEINPTLQLDTAFMFQFGEILYQNRNFDQAKAILNKSLETSNVETYKKQIENLLSILNKQDQTLKG